MDPPVGFEIPFFCFSSVILATGAELNSHLLFRVSEGLDPFKSEKCDKTACPLCKNGSKMPCNTNNIGYRWTCKTCRDQKIKKVYEGESSRSDRVRGAEHIRNYEKKKVFYINIKCWTTRMNNHNLKWK